MSQFTPGPWSIPTSPGSSNGIAHSGGYVAFVCIPRKVDEARLDGESWLDMRSRTKSERDAIKKEEDANRRLIAAAPEMLAALQAFMDAYDNESTCNYPEHRMARAVIAKATGEQA